MHVLLSSPHSTQFASHAMCQKEKRKEENKQMQISFLTFPLQTLHSFPFNVLVASHSVHSSDVVCFEHEKQCEMLSLQTVL